MLDQSGFIVPHFLPFGEIVRFNAERSPQNVATTQDGCSTTWMELEKYSNQIAHGLLREGLCDAARVGYLGRTTDIAFQIMHGTAKSRCVFTAVNWRLAPQEVAFILKDAQIEFLFVEEEFLPLVEDFLSGNRRIKRSITIDRVPKHGGRAFMDWRDSNPTEHLGLDMVSEDVVLQLYTSGTTGNPKGTLITQEFVMNAGRTWYACEEDVFGMLPGEEHLNYLPIFHNSGAISAHYGPFARGCGIVIMPEFDVERVLEYIDQRSIPMIQGVATILQMLMVHPKSKRVDFSGLRYIIYGGSPMPIPLRDRLVEHFECRFCQGYGATECLSISVLTPADHETNSDRLKSVGRAMSGVSLKIVDPQRREVPTGTVGEIAVQSPTLALGYWNLPEATASAFENGWYYTGDGGCLDADGYLYLKERINDMIISGGENIYPTEVENVLCMHTSVESAAVVAVPDEKWGEIPLAFIILKDGEPFDLEGLKSHVDSHLAKYKQPKRYRCVEAFPLNTSGKVLKRKLRELANATDQ